MRGCSDRLHDFSVTIPRCYKNVYVDSFFLRTAKLGNSLPIECFPLTYDLNLHLLTVGSPKQKKKHKKIKAYRKSV